MKSRTFPLFLAFLLSSLNLLAQTSNNTCSTALPFCGSSVYTFPSGGCVNNCLGETGPCYGCLGLVQNPAWYYLQVSSAGKIVLSITELPYTDIDFVCWGPFATPTGACTAGLTCAKIASCGFGPFGNETCTINNAQVGEFYLLVISNFTNFPTQVSFVQSNWGQSGAGATNCNLVVHCAVSSVTAVASSCSSSTNTHSVSGQVEFSNPPPSGTLTVTDITAIPPVSQTFNFPFTSPTSYNLTGIPCDGTLHTIQASFSDSATCNETATYQSPQPQCPTAVISGGGSACNTGTTTIPVYIQITGSTPPYSFTYAINGSLQPPVTGYSGPFPYQILASTSGVYTLVSVSSGACSGTVSGSATVTMNPIPALTNYPLSDTLCTGVPFVLNLTSTLPSTSFSWNASLISGNVTGFSDGTGSTINQTLINNGFSAGVVKYTLHLSTALCSGEDTSYDVVVKPIPTITNNPTTSTLCSGNTTNILLTSTVSGTTFSWIASGSSANITGFSNGSGSLIAQQLISATPTIETVSYQVTPSAYSCTGSAVQFEITVNPKPVVTSSICLDSVTTLSGNPIPLKGAKPLGGSFSGPGVLSGVFYPSSAGVGNKSIVYNYTNTFGCSSSASKTIKVIANSSFSCGSNLTDIRDNQTYPTVQIGSQCWMASNLNYGQSVPSTQHQRDNCVAEKYTTPSSLLSGASYQWDELMNYTENMTFQSLCPPGWHVPTTSDWATLFTNWTNNGFAGSPLKYSGYSGFNALLVGVNHLNRQWDFTTFATFFWSSNAIGMTKAWAHGLNDTNPSVSDYPSLRSHGFSVRCLKN